MRSLFVFPFLFGCTISTGASTSNNGGSAATGDTPPDAEMQTMVEAHNAARAAVSPAPVAPLGKLVWSETAADVARGYAAKCVFEHNPERGKHGENLFASTGGAGPQAVVDAWVGEQAQYSYDTNTCQKDAMCGHYTQVVWAETTHVGCAKQACPAEGGPFGNRAWEIWVCNYSPPGNYVGEKPY